MVIDYQGDTVSDIALTEKEKLYDGSMRYNSDMSESDIRNEIVRLVKQKNIPTHELQLIDPKDFDFVRCVNKVVKNIDGDTPFDASGISQVYKNGYVYVRLNSTLLQYVRLAFFRLNFVFNNTFYFQGEHDGSDEDDLPPVKMFKIMSGKDMSSPPANTPLEISPVGSTIPKGTKQLSLKGCFSGKKEEECTVRIHIFY